MLSSGEGDVGEKGEGNECYLLVPRIGSGAACGVGAMERGGGGGSVSTAAARRRGLEGAARFGSFGRRWESCWGALFGRERAGEAAPAAANGDGGGVPAGLGGQDLAMQLQGEVGMPFRGLAWAEEGWRRELGGGARAAAMAALVRRGRWPGWLTGGSGRWSRKG